MAVFCALQSPSWFMKYAMRGMQFTMSFTALPLLQYTWKQGSQAGSQAGREGVWLRVVSAVKSRWQLNGTVLLPYDMERIICIKTMRHIIAKLFWCLCLLPKNVPPMKPQKFDLVSTPLAYIFVAIKLEWYIYQYSIVVFLCYEVFCFVNEYQYFWETWRRYRPKDHPIKTDFILKIKYMYIMF